MARRVRTCCCVSLRGRSMAHCAPFCRVARRRSFSPPSSRWPRSIARSAPIRRSRRTASPSAPTRSPTSELASAAREVLDRHYAGEVDAAKELFQTRLGQRRATTDIGEAARAATNGAVELLLVDIDQVLPGTVDRRPRARSRWLRLPVPGSYDVIDEIRRARYFSRARKSSACARQTSPVKRRLPRSCAILMMEVSSDTLIGLDRNFFASWPDIGVAQFVGLDISESAIRYANDAGLHVDGIAIDLERENLSPKQAAILAPVNVVLSTGSIGYVTDRTYRKILDAVAGGAWVISFVLRMFPYDNFVSAFAERGLITEKLTSTTFIQRRFRDADELEKCLAALAKRGIDTEGFESDGLFQAELFLSRPEADARAAPLSRMITISSGRYSTFGARYVQVGQEDERRIAIEA
jgi:hypothetical protein